MKWDSGLAIYSDETFDSNQVISILDEVLPATINSEILIPVHPFSLFSEEDMQGFLYCELLNTNHLVGMFSNME